MSSKFYFPRKFKYIFTTVDDDDKSTELADATVVAAYGKCEWQKPKNNQKVGCYQEPIFRSTDATNGGIVNNLSKVWKSCDCRGN